MKEEFVRTRRPSDSVRRIHGGLSVTAPLEEPAENGGGAGCAGGVRKSVIGVMGQALAARRRRPGSSCGLLTSRVELPTAAHRRQ